MIFLLSVFGREVLQYAAAEAGQAAVSPLSKLAKKVAKNRGKEKKTPLLRIPGGREEEKEFSGS